MSNLKTIKLTGVLGKEFGKLHRFAVSSPAEAVRALCANFPRFKARVLALSEAGIEYRILTGRRELPVRDDPKTLQAKTGANSITISPVVAGAKRGGVLQTIIGIILIVVGSYFGQTWMVQLGTSMVIGGVAQMLTPVPKSRDPSSNERPENAPSYVFNGAVNTIAQGHPVSVGYGRLIIGSAVISAGMHVEEIPT